MVLTTHINADGDGAGSEVALARYLERLGVRVTIVNPTPFPATFAFLLEGLETRTSRQRIGQDACEEADLFVVLDTSEPSRLGDMWPVLRARRVAVIDHHPPSPQSMGDPAVRDPSACATGELVYELIPPNDEPLPKAEADALYVAIVTDTGSFRFANTTPRTHEICAELLRAGVDPEFMYRELYGQVTSERLELLRRALSAVARDPDWPIAWITLRRQDFSESGGGASDLEGIIEHARRLKDIEVALLFRELADGSTKVSLRSNGEADVAAIARQHGGGGHIKAAGVHMSTALQKAQEKVLASVRQELDAAGLGPAASGPLER